MYYTMSYARARACNLDHHHGDQPHGHARAWAKVIKAAPLFFTPPPIGLAS